MQISIFDILFDFFDILINFSSTAYEILFTPIEILGYQIQLFYLMGGGLFITLFIAWFIKRFI
jgi:hypothetical protein